MLANKYSVNSSDTSAISINASTGVCSYTSYSSDMHYAHIVKCTVRYDGVDYYATMPVITARANSGYSIKLKDNTGFRFATYSPDGRTPSYDNTNPFEIIVTQQINGYTEDISRMTNSYAVTYN